MSSCDLNSEKDEGEGGKAIHDTEGKLQTKTRDEKHETKGGL